MAALALARRRPRLRAGIRTHRALRRGVRAARTIPRSKRPISAGPRPRNKMHAATRSHPAQSAHRRPTGDASATSASRDGRIAAIEPRIGADAQEERARTAVSSSGASSKPTSISTSRASSIAASWSRHPRGGDRRGRRRQARFHRGRCLRARPPHAGEGDRAAARRTCARMSRSIRGIGLRRLQRDAPAEDGLRVGDRPRDLRLSAGGADQRSRHRGADGRGLRSRRRRGRRLPLHRHEPARADRAHLRDRAALRPRHRLASRLRSRPELDASRRGVPADRQPRNAAGASRSATSPSCRRSTAQSSSTSSHAASPTPASRSPCCRRPICS